MKIWVLAAALMLTACEGADIDSDAEPCVEPEAYDLGAESCEAGGRDWLTRSAAHPNAECWNQRFAEGWTDEGCEVPSE